MKWSILDRLEPEHARAVIARCVRRRYRKGDTLFHEGDPGSSFLLLDTGRVAVRVSTPQGDVATLAVLGPGDVFGEQALLEPGGLRTASAVALEPVETLTLGAADFDALRTADPSVERVLTQLLAAQVRRLSTALVEALYLPADKRVLRRVVELAELYRRPDAAATDPVTIALTQDDVAALAGTTRPTANRTLQDAVDAGLVTLARGRITVVDAAGLARRAR